MSDSYDEPELLEVRCALDGNYYTEVEFIDYFGGRQEWDDAADPTPVLPKLSEVPAVPSFGAAPASSFGAAPASSFGAAPASAPSSLFGSNNTSEDFNPAFIPPYQRQWDKECKVFWSSASLEDGIAAQNAERAKASDLVREELKTYEDSINRHLIGIFSAANSNMVDYGEKSAFST